MTDQPPPNRHIIIILVLEGEGGTFPGADEISEAVRSTLLATYPGMWSIVFPKDVVITPTAIRWRVNVSHVNVRAGPGTNYPILKTLAYGDILVQREVSASGWVRGEHGWVAASVMVKLAS